MLARGHDLSKELGFLQLGNNTLKQLRTQSIWAAIPAIGGNRFFILEGIWWCLTASVPPMQSSTAHDVIPGVFTLLFISLRRRSVLDREEQTFSCIDEDQISNSRSIQELTCSGFSSWFGCFLPYILNFAQGCLLLLWCLSELLLSIGLLRV